MDKTVAALILRLLMDRLNEADVARVLDAAHPATAAWHIKQSLGLSHHEALLIAQAIRAK